MLPFVLRATGIQLSHFNVRISRDLHPPRQQLQDTDGTIIKDVVIKMTECDNQTEKADTVGKRKLDAFTSDFEATKSIDSNDISRQQQDEPSFLSTKNPADKWAALIASDGWWFSRQCDPARYKAFFFETRRLDSGHSYPPSLRKHIFGLFHLSFLSGWELTTYRLSRGVFRYLIRIKIQSSLRLAQLSPPQTSHTHHPYSYLQNISRSEEILVVRSETSASLLDYRSLTWSASRAAAPG